MWKMFQATTALCSTERQLKVCTWSPNSRPRSTPSLPKQRKRDRSCAASPLFSRPIRRRYFSVILELGEINLNIERQAQRRIVSLTLHIPNGSRNQVVLKVRPTPRVCHGDIP